MLKIKQVQDALKAEKVTLNQSQISSILTDLNIDISLCEESQLETVVQAIKGRAGANGSLTVGGKNRKATLSIPEVPSVDNLPAEQQNGNRQQAHTDIYTSKMLDTAEQISNRNVEMVKALPQLVEARTLQKLHESAPEIQDLWDATNDRLTSAMFGL